MLLAKLVFTQLETSVWISNTIWGIDHVCLHQDLRDSIHMLISGTVNDFDIYLRL